MADKPLATKLQEELLRWEDDLKSLREEWDKMWRAWRITPPERASTETIEGRQVNHTNLPVNPFLAQYTVPYRFHVVETIMPRILGDDPKITYQPRDYDDDEPVARIMSVVVQQQLGDMGFDLEIRDFIRQALICNYSVAKVYWTREVRDQVSTTVQTVPDEEIAGVTYDVEQENTSMRVEMNEPGFEVVDVRDFVWPLTAKSIQKAPAVWQRRWVTRGYLEQMQQTGHYQNVDKIGLIDSTDQWIRSRQAQLAIENSHPTPPSRGEKDPDDIIEIWERWTNTHVHVLADPRGSNILLRDEDSPFNHQRKPFVDYTPIPILGQFHGMSIIRTIYDLAEHLDTMRRQASDALTYILNPMWFASDNTDRSQLVARPGGIVTGADESEKPVPLIMPQIDFAAVAQQEARIYDDMQRTSGATTWLDGTAGLTRASATGVSTIVQEANKRLTEMVKVFDQRCMRELAIQMWRNNEQFLDEGIAVDLTQDPAAAQAFEQFIQEERKEASGVSQIPPEMLRADGRLRAVPLVGQDIELSKQQKASSAVQIGTAVAPALPVLMQQGVDFKKLYDYILEELGVPKDIRDEVMAPPPPAAIPAPGGGPSGESLPTGQPPGAIGQPGPAGAYGMAAR